ncbi:MAG: YhbY family RNA-binding protein [Pseudomonadales bacterium]|nr:YhbY family RNA-binding protein [Pseudomonadales bacterium]
MASQTERKRFRAIGHHLKPVVTIAGNGLSEGVTHELERALGDHELIKIRVNADRDERKQLIQAVLDATDAELIQQLGATALLYRPSDKPDPALSNLLRSVGSDT